MLNVSETDFPSMENAYVQRVREYAQAEGNCVIPICASIEEEIAQLQTGRAYTIFRKYRTP